MFSFRDVKFKHWYDGTVTVEIGEGKFLRRITTTSQFDLSDEPYHWGSWTKASEEFLSYVKLQTALVEKAYRERHVR